MTACGTADFARHILTSAALVCVAPTATSAEIGFLRPAMPKMKEALRHFSRTEQDADADFISLQVSSEQPDVSPIERETSEQERVIASLRRLNDLGANWDGEGALPPLVHSLRLASNFVCELNRHDPMPEPMLHPSGEAGLFWNDEGLYGDLKFLGDGRVAYFIRRGQSRHKGIVDSSEIEVFAVLHPVLFPPLTPH